MISKSSVINNYMNFREKDRHLEYREKHVCDLFRKSIVLIATCE